MNVKTKSPNRLPNRLKDEKSPYLLQHADNPVDWYPWGEAAFEKARNEDKPILVSIGYSTCHWCHVMADESFSDPDTAAIMNRHFVNIKVDREERPDIDTIYISAVSAMTGSAGWPLNVFLTPDGRPFYGGTYFPPTRRVSPSWREILTAIAEAYGDSAKRKELLQSADKITGLLKNYLDADVPGHQKERPGLKLLAPAVDAISELYDPKNGGFSKAPKFPMPPMLSFLLFYNRFASHVKKDFPKGREALKMAVHTLEKIAAGGIHDHLGGGFHRYATDERWHVPHFEKMLYDNAQLIRLYVEAYDMTGNRAFASAAKDGLAYVLREMTHPEGAFYSAEDADSVYVDLSGASSDIAKEGKKAEGGFYVWHHDEIMNILKKEQKKGVFDIFAFCYGLQPEGNVAHDPLGEFTGKNILHRVRTIQDAAKQFGMTEGDIEQALAIAREALFSARNHRPRPHLDDKVLVEWNGLMISAFAAAYRVFGDRKYLLAAEAAISFIHENIYEDKSRENESAPELYRRWRDGEKKIPAMAADYAFLIQGLLDAYEAGFDAFHLDWAVLLAGEMINRFFDQNQGGFYTTGEAQDPHLLLQAKDPMDNVMPSVDAVAVMNFIRLYRYTGNRDFFQAADKTLAAAADRMETHPSAVPSMITALAVSRLTHASAVVVGSKDSEEADVLADVIHAYPREAVTPVWIDGQEAREKLTVHMPHVKDMTTKGSRPKVFVCFGRTCHEPVSDVEMLENLLETAFESPLQDFL